MGDQTSGTRPPGIMVADIQVPGFALKAGQTVPPPRIAGSAGDIVADSRKALTEQQYTDLDQVTAADSWHEAEYFRASAAAIDNVVALMRLIEGRAALYQQLINDANTTRAAVANSADAASARLTAINVGLEEARQDVGMAIALRAEEQARVDALNAQRAAILAANVRMIVFRRPRATPHVRIAASAPAPSALTETPILACTRSHPAVPEVLRQYVSTLRLGPVFWFRRWRWR
jgi:ribosomal protein L18